MSIRNTQLYTLRPNGTSLWIPADTAKAMGITRGQRLTPEQLETGEIADIIAGRVKKEGKKGISES